MLTGWTKWVKWDGGTTPPVPDDCIVEVVFRHGTDYGEAKSFDWRHFGSVMDIVRYRAITTDDKQVKTLPTKIQPAEYIHTGQLRLTVETGVTREALIQLRHYVDLLIELDGK